MGKILKPSKKVVNYWINSLLPEKDIFFFKTKPKFKNAKVLTIEEYLKQFNNLEYDNAYCRWIIKKTAKYAIMDNENFIASLTKKDLFKLYKEQILLERGLIIENFTTKNKFLNSHVINNNLVLNHNIYDKLNFKLKKQLAISYAKEQDEWNYYNPPKQFKYFKQIANNFVLNDFCNCLAATAYAITKNTHYLDNWLSPTTFKSCLKENSYYCVKKEIPNSNDVLVFYNNKQLVHACFVLNNNLCLNKSGQSKFNPICIKTLNYVFDDYKNFEYKVFRKK